MNTSVEQLRHPKEKTYFTVLAVIAVLVWIPLVPFIVMGIPITLLIIFIGWIINQYMKAIILGYSVKVSEQQFPEIYERAQHLRRELGMSTLPDIYVVNSHGIIQATAVRILGSKYVFLYSSLVDLMLLKGHKKELDFVLGHELGHHAAGHISIWKSVLLAIVKHLPLVGKAYGRACELTADRIGHHLIGDQEASKRALSALALGSSSLLEELDINAFKHQESQIPDFMGFIHKVFSQYPRLTTRVIEIEAFDEYNGYLKSRSNQTSHSRNQAASAFSSGGSAKFCGKCGTQNSTEDKFCANCGNGL